MNSSRHYVRTPNSRNPGASFAQKKRKDRAPWNLTTVSDFLAELPTPTKFTARDSAYHWLVRGIVANTLSASEVAQARGILDRALETGDLRDNVRYAIRKAPEVFEDLMIRAGEPT